MIWTCGRSGHFSEIGAVGTNAHLYQKTEAIQKIAQYLVSSEQLRKDVLLQL
jgi:hypothetical protein